MPTFNFKNHDTGEEFEEFFTSNNAKYEWLETQYTANANSTIVSTTSQGITYGSKNILNYVDVDETLDEFVQYLTPQLNTQ